MKIVELMEIALKHVEKGYNYDQLRDGDDLYHATEEESDTCVDFMSQCEDEGLISFRKKIKKLKGNE